MDRNALARATEATSAPTPGYLYVDICRAAAASPMACADMAKYLVRRLESKSNPNVKHKCLKVMAKVAADPANRSQFKRVLAQDHAALKVVKDCLNYRGPPDAVRGDEPSERVRAAAKECLDAVYSDSPSSMGGGGGGGSAAMGMGMGVGMGGGGGGAAMGASYGAPAAGGGGQMGPPGSAPPGAHPHATRRMEGIGNPQFADPRMAGGSGGIGGGIAGGVDVNRLKSMAATAAEGFRGIIADPLARGADAPGGMPHHSTGSYGGPSAYSNPPGRAELSAATNGQWTMASNRGANAVGAGPQFAHAQPPPPPSGISAANRGVGGSWGSGGSVPAATIAGPSSGGLGAVAASPPPAMGGGQAGGSASDGTYERNLVMELCPPGGMKAEPPPDKLAQFARAIPSLNSDLVCPILLDCLDDGQPWIIKAKALCVIERTVLAADEAGNSAYSSFFHACSDEIEPLTVHNRSAIRDPARRVLNALGLEVAYPANGGGAGGGAGKPAARGAPPLPPPPADLLDFGEPAPSSNPAPAPVDPVPAPAPALAPAFAPAPTPPSAAPSAPAGDMFGGLTTKVTKGPAPLLAGPVPAPAAALPGGLFGDMNVKANGSAEVAATNGTAGETPADTAATLAQGGSAFGFMNGGGDAATPASAPKDPPDTAAAPPPTPAEGRTEEKSFDPLLSLTGPSEPTTQEKVAKTQAQIAQMQAAAMQQQMMMMQQQMAQMQMAQMQMGGGARPPPPAMPGAHAMKSNVMSGNSSGASAGFSFLDNKNAASDAKKKQNEAFNFVADDMKKG
jgi:hypothetical protein